MTMAKNLPVSCIKVSQPSGLTGLATGWLPLMFMGRGTWCPEFRVDFVIVGLQWFRPGGEVQRILLVNCLVDVRSLIKLFDMMNLRLDI